MYKWDKELLHRALDLELEAMRVGRPIRFDFPHLYDHNGDLIDMDDVTLWDYKKEIMHMRKTVKTNEGLSSMLDRLEKELSQDGNHPGTKVSPNETLPHNYKEEEGECQDGSA